MSETSPPASPPVPPHEPSATEMAAWAEQSSREYQRANVQRFLDQQRSVTSVLDIKTGKLTRVTQAAAPAPRQAPTPTKPPAPATQFHSGISKSLGMATSMAAAKEQAQQAEANLRASPAYIPTDADITSQIDRLVRGSGRG